MHGLPHDRLSPGSSKCRRQDLRTFDVEDHGCSATEPPYGIPSEEHQRLVTVDDLTGLVHCADPVCVSIEGDSQLCSASTDLQLKVTQVLGHGGIGVMVREGTIRLTEQRCDLRAESAEGGDGNQAPGPVAAVDHHTDGPLELMPAEN